MAPRINHPGVHAYYWDGAVPVAHELRDLSTLGAYLCTAERWYPGTIVQFTFGLATQEAPGSGDVTEGSVQLRARVVRHGSDGVGIQFVYLKQQERVAMREFLKRIGRTKGYPPPLRRYAPVHGGGLVEFALVLPLLFVLLVNVVNFGGFFFAWITIANAARAGVQYAVMGGATVTAPAPPTPSQVTTLVTTDISSLLNRASALICTRINNNGTLTTNGSCTGANGIATANDPEPLSYVAASVDVTYTYQPFIPLFNFPNLNIHATLPSTTIHRKAVMRMIQ